MGLFRLNPKKVNIKYVLLCMPFVFCFSLYATIDLLRPVFMSLEDMALLEGRIHDSYPYTTHDWRGRMDKSILVRINDSILVQFPDSRVFKPYWPEVNQAQNVGRAIRVYALEKEIESYVSVGMDTINYFTSPYQLEAETSESSSNTLTIEEKRIMIENGDSSFLKEPIPLHSERWKVLIPRSELDFSRTIGGCSFFLISVLSALLFFSAAITYYETRK